MPNNRITLGKEGEFKAAAFLEGKGYKIIAHNYRSPLGEVDLICKNKDEIIFIEVKTRSTLAFGDGAEAVSRQKQEKLIKTALFFLKANQLEAAPFRFDVISILLDRNEQITHIPHAFP